MPAAPDSSRKEAVEAIPPTGCAALSVGWLSLALSASHAYDLRTHTLLSERAFTTSVEVQRSSDVGLSRTRVLDLGSATKPERLADFTNDGTPLGWLVEGSIREIDYNTNLAIVGCAKPRNPPSAIDRVRHHFYDPDTNGGLGSAPSPGCPRRSGRSESWGAGRGRPRISSLRDARLYQLRSLIEAMPEERERQAALMFRSLGQVIHILEDMAQPQHTRGDVHPACETLLESVIPEHNWYESYIEQRVRGGQFRGRLTTPFHLASYPAPSFATTRSFFTAVGQRGLAEFSSHNFFTTRTNLWSLPIPCGRRVSRRVADPYTPVDVSKPVKTALGPIVEAKVRLYLRMMLDPITGALIPDVAVNSRSVWDQHLEQRGDLPNLSVRLELRCHQRCPVAARGRLCRRPARSLLRRSARRQCPACR